MTIVIKRSLDKARIQQLLGTLPRTSKFNAQKFCGVLKLKRPPLEIQKELRDEWK